MTSRLMITDRTKILNKRLFCFNNHHEFISINKEKDQVYLKHGVYSWYFVPNRNFYENQLLKLPLKEQIPLLDTRYGAHNSDIVTKDTVDSSLFDIQSFNVNEVNKLKDLLDKDVIRQQKFKQILLDFPAIPEGYIGWYEVTYKE